MLSMRRPSIGSVGDAFGNALAETMIGLYTTEAVRDDSPFRRGPQRRLADVELLTNNWVRWFNRDRLMHRLGRRPPIEHEAEYYANPAQRPRWRQTTECAPNPAGFTYPTAVRRCRPASVVPGRSPWGPWLWPTPRSRPCAAE